MLITSIGCPICAGTEIDKGAQGAAVARAARETMRGARITTEIAQLHQCAEGHDFLLQVQDGGHALLYERALQRLVDGRTRDAVLDAYTALDMFLVSFVLGIAFETRYPRPTTFDAAPVEVLREDLKDVLKSSERTLGAALALACVASGKGPPKIPTRLNELRNKAVHAGAYPSDADAEWACLQVEQLVCVFREHVPVPAVEADPFDRFQMALLLESRRRALGSQRPPLTVTYRLFTVLDATNLPAQGRVADRIDAYRRGERSLSID